MRLEDLVKDVRDIAPLPKAYLRIQEIIEDPNASLDELTSVINNDPGLTGRILRIANSAYVGLPVKVDTVGRAVQVLGLNQVHDLALASAATSSLYKIQSKAIDVYDFWRRSFYCGIVARLFAKRAGMRNAERVFVAGLLHEIGNLLLAFKEPPLYSELRDTAIRRQTPLFIQQREHLGFDYADIGAALLKQWRLPEALFEPVLFHTSDLAKIPPTIVHDTAFIHLGAVVSRAAMWTSERDEPVPEFDPVASQLVHLDDKVISETMTEADPMIVEAMSLLLPDLRPGVRKSAA